MKGKKKKYIYIYRYTSRPGILHRTGTDLSQSQLQQQSSSRLRTKMTQPVMFIYYL